MILIVSYLPYEYPSPHILSPEILRLIASLNNSLKYFIWTYFNMILQITDYNLEMLYLYL